MTSPPGENERPGVYARLAEEAEIRHVVHTPSRAARWLGRAIVLAMVAGVVLAALRANPW